ncbi:MAG: hypothetical protein K6G11_01190 [Lachnospiraceae bacterium]|nr:hypothetical protein [Lachnospiraceae bacterium]
MSNPLLSRTFKFDLKKDIAPVLLYSIILFIVLVFGTMGAAIDLRGDIFEPNNIEYLNFEFWNNALVYPYSGLFIVMIFATFTGIYQFKFLHNKKQVDFMQSLPQNRIKIFTTRYVLGALEIIVPYVVAIILGSLVAAGLAPCSGVLPRVVIGCILTIIYALMFYSISILATCISGNGFTGICGILVLHFVTSVIGLMLDIALEVIYTFKGEYDGWYDNYIDTIGYKISDKLGEFNVFAEMYKVRVDYFDMNYPMHYYDSVGYKSDYFDKANIDFVPVRVCIYIAVLAFLVGMAILAYRKAKLERCTEAFYYTWLETLFAILVTEIAGFFTAVAIGYMFSGLAIFLTLISVFVTHGIVEFVHTRDIKKTFRHKVRLILCMIMPLIFAIMQVANNG